MFHTFKLHVTSLIMLLVFCLQFVNGQTSIATIGTAYNQNFNSLQAGAQTWSNNSTLPGWYALARSGTSYVTPTSYVLSTGGSTTVALTSFGLDNTATDRALGFVPGGNTGVISYYGWRLKNNTGQAINQIAVDWTGEQWRVTTALAQSLTMYYQISASAITSIVEANLIATSNTFTSPKSGLSATALDGNLAANRITMSSVLNVTIPAGSEILICWGDVREVTTGSMQLLSIDDVSVTAKAGQTITFDNIADKRFGDSPFTLTASASSGLPVSYSSNNLNVATISGDQLTIVGPGKATITASQDGNSFYRAATSEDRIINVSPADPQSTVATNITSTSFTINWLASNGLNESGTIYGVEYGRDKTFDNVDDYQETSDKFLGLTGLTPNSIYFYHIYSVNDQLYSNFSEASAITTGTDYVSVDNGNWDVNNRWDVNNSPGAIANMVTIGHSITANNLTRDSIIVNGLTMETTGKLTNAEHLRVANQLILKVDANGNSGKILNNSNFFLGNNVEIRVRKTFAAGQWHFVGFPFNITSVLRQNGSPATWGDLGETSADFIVQSYNGAGRASAGIVNTTGEGLNWANVSPHQFTARTGYIIYTPNAITLDFVTSAKNKLDIFKTSSNVTIGLYPSSISSLHSGWNLTASPFVSSYDLYNSTANAPYYVYNGVNYDYIMSGDHYYLQPFSSFFLQARSTNFSYSNAGRMLLSKDVASIVDYDEIGLKLKNTTYSDVTRIRLKSDASNDYEIGNDAVKMFSLNSSVPQIYSVLNNTSYAVNAVPYATKEFTFYTKIGTAGTYTLELLPEYFAPNCTAVQVYDKVANKTVNLTTAGSYTFTSSAGTTNRFKVTVTTNNTDVTTSTNTLDNSAVSVFVSDNEAHFTGLTKDVNVSIYDVSGKLIQSFTGVKNQQILKIDKKGLLLFKVISDDNTYIILKALNK